MRVMRGGSETVIGLRRHPRLVLVRVPDGCCDPGADNISAMVSSTTSRRRASFLSPRFVSRQTITLTGDFAVVRSTSMRIERTCVLVSGPELSLWRGANLRVP
jgi:hypothetical protein